MASVRHYDKPHGVIPAVLMPFTADMEVNEKAYRKHLGDVSGVEGITAITINGHAAEVASLTMEEQFRAIAVTKEELQERVPTIVAVYTNSSLEAARIARRAQDEGANGLLVFPPEVMVLGGHIRPEMILEHYKRITHASDLPIIHYQFPVNSNLAIPLPTLLELCTRFPSIKAIKDNCGDGNLHERQIRELKALDRPVNTVTTHSSWLLGSLALGCDGLLSGAGSVIANLQVALFRAVQAGDLNAARAINDKIYPTVRAFYDHPLLDMHNRMKEALVILGRWDGAHVRPPLVKPTAAEIEKIRRCVAQAGLTSETVYKKVA
ncbi:dihydrodipicolinate synthase family protein [Sinorhizobium alkalisoli]|uniref:Dihydrodipicolinate synthase family protein n=1 Tax=Sinorhizobium alkalisoli TaxID=1752398 RepID=A0A1E3VC37_9HYPH|nr:dihydrodipicolinate synthase family protein [Sinorhizobium alkalisoli]MCA1494120.1 dihydrodipicolinate synthase family protein [Ensifer sp. NBAIM29]MCG5479986.1 dihydrodipicolinate synthase family protein [Sinorhizobium alkalisoli]ODR91140.1 dihydrodipicolinate synthase family protein [Sinorhizobium alkalisoli]QFI66803.1 4-hydroxy-tetrahydrodipicolinate synthase [Sinorhizobium alkalisoli]